MSNPSPANGGDSLDQAYAEVREFHAAFNTQQGNRPRALRGHEKSRRLEWLREELRELEAAETIEDQVDAVMDTIYFALGFLVEMSVPPTGMWRAVHQANMAKVRPDGICLDAVGKVVKPRGWKGPEEAIGGIVAALLADQEEG